MKRLILVLLLVAVGAGGRAQSAPDRLWDMANTAYINADYDKAISCYDSILTTGRESYKLYYNLGNAHFKRGHVGASILNYKRAQRLAPGDGDIAYNLRIANTRVKDQIDEVPRFFLAEWMDSLRRSLGADGWAAISLGALALALAGLMFYLLSGRLSLRKAGFTVAVAGAVVFLFAWGAGNSQRRAMLHSQDAVVMTGAAAVKSSPDNASKDIFILHEGTTVRLLETLNGWTEIQIADGKKGWIQTSAIEVI